MGTRTATNLMKEKKFGYIINLGGGGVQELKPFGSAYGAAKTAIVKFTETVAVELEREGLNIKMFAFNPGFICNQRTEKLVESDVARIYMPKLEQILKYGKMSDIGFEISGNVIELSDDYPTGSSLPSIKLDYCKKVHIENNRFSDLIGP